MISDQGSAGDTADAAPSEAGDTAEDSPTGSSADAPESGGDGPTDVDELAKVRAQLEQATRERDALAADVKKSARKRDQVKSRAAEDAATLEQQLDGLRAELEAEKTARLDAEKASKASTTTAEILDGLHPDHRTSKTTRRILAAIAAEGVDFAADDAVKATADILRAEHPELYEPKRRPPTLGGVPAPDRGTSGGKRERLI